MRDDNMSPWTEFRRSMSCPRSVESVVPGRSCNNGEGSRLGVGENATKYPSTSYRTGTERFSGVYVRINGQTKNPSLHIRRREFVDN